MSMRTASVKLRDAAAEDWTADDLDLYTPSEAMTVMALSPDRYLAEHWTTGDPLTDVQLRVMVVAGDNRYDDVPPSHEAIYAAGVEEGLRRAGEAVATLSHAVASKAVAAILAARDLP